MKQGIKKAVVGILAVSMVASVGAVSAFAAGTGRNFADADGNGVCDKLLRGADCKAGRRALYKKAVVRILLMQTTTVSATTMPWDRQQVRKRVRKRPPP